MTDTSDELRIIASDATLPVQDRDVLVGAADQIDYLCRQLAVTQLKLIEAQAHLIAVNERALEQSRKPVLPMRMTLLNISAPLQFRGWGT